MASEPQIQEEFSPEMNFRKLLSAAVQHIQWTYAIFWSIPNEHQGVLSWSNGYYNGDIKTRKTTQPMELHADDMGMQRSEHLRELYVSLSVRGPSALLSPEDLTNAEWYYLLCMSYTFPSGQGLPGKAFDCNQHVWWTNGNYSNRYFKRSILAKSASIESIVCLPFTRGVLELGTTATVIENPDIIQQITDAFWGLPFPASSGHYIDESRHVSRLVDDFATSADVVDDGLNLIDNDSDVLPSLLLYSPGGSLNEHLLYHVSQNTDIEEHEGFGPHNSSLHWSSCMSRSSYLSPENDRTNNHVMDLIRDSDYSAPFSSGMLSEEDYLYTRMIVGILRDSGHMPSSMPISIGGFQRSSFTTWNKGTDSPLSLTRATTPQSVLKRVFADISSRHLNTQQKSHNDCSSPGNKFRKVDGEDCSASHVLSERRRREKLNEKFVALKSLIPSISKTDKASVLGDTIKYVKDLKRRVTELESHRAERTEDSYADTAVSDGLQASSNNKRKAWRTNEGDAERQRALSSGSPVKLNVTVIGREVAVEMCCPWRDRLFPDVIDAMSGLDLDVHSVQSSTAECGVLGMELKAKFRGLPAVTPGFIRQVLQRIVGGVPQA